MAAKRLTKKVKWVDAMKGASSFRPYSASDSFNIGDCIEHSKFGKGFVDTSFGNKIEVIFEDKMRLLVHKVVF